MKQILQSFKDGKTFLEEVPVPGIASGKLLIRTTHSLVSIGTERMLVEFGKSNLLSKAKQQPERVSMVLDKIKSDGLFSTINAVLNKLDQPIPLGYCNVGIVIGIGEGVTGFSIGDRVASNGNHSEYVSVSQNLVVKIPDSVSSEEATFTVIGSIGLQGLRLCNPSFGENIVVFGLGLIGLITIQLLKANGCRVIGIDIDENKCILAKKYGITTINPKSGTDPVKSVLEITSNNGADGVLITASSKTNEIISQAAKMSRKRGKIVLVGVVGLDINRSDFYEKELTFQVSCSYGPGRYDANYEQKGIDLPIAYVRWSEKRNFETVLQSIENKLLSVNDLITEILDIGDFGKVYDHIGENKSIATIFKYNTSVLSEKELISNNLCEVFPQSFEPGQDILGIIGSGNFTKMTMLPALKKAGAKIKYIASSNGVSSSLLAKKFKIQYSTTDYKQILNDSSIGGVMITTRHNSHARFVIEALKANKHVFVEKPLAITPDHLTSVLSIINEQIQHKTLTVGFNRRFSPHTQAVKKSIAGHSGNINIVTTMNAGFIPRDSWVHDLSEGGGRIIGEACHLIDLCLFLADSEISSVCMTAMGINPESSTDNASILLKFKNGSNASVNYFSNGSKSYSKERIEVYSHECTWIIDNFKTTKAYGVKGFRDLKTGIDKGHASQFREYLSRMKNGGDPLIPINEIVNVAKSSFAAIKSLKEKCWINVE